jgi:hypothetical protein
MSKPRTEPCCARCGTILYQPDQGARVSRLRRQYACDPYCVIDVTGDVLRLFAGRVPDGQYWHLGTDDIDTQAEADVLDSLPRLTVEIVHPGGILTTRPIPVEYAHRIASQAQRLGYTAMINEGATAR